MPEPLGRPVTISCFVNANHAGNVVTRRLHSGVLVFQATEYCGVEQFWIGVRCCKDCARCDCFTRIKLRMFGCPIDGPANVFCDNQGAVKNASLPESTLSKKHNAINCHVVREAAAAGILRFGKKDGETNLADLLTKILPVPRRKLLLGSILYRRMKKFLGA